MLTRSPAPVSALFISPVCRVVALLTVLLSAAAPAAAQTIDETPSGMVAFFMYSGTGCPTGWAAFTQGAGMLLLGVTDPQAVGVTQGTPMQDSTAPVHTHSFATRVTITQKDIEADTGSNHDGARSDQTPSVPQSPPGTTNGGTGESASLPFIQLVVCQKQ